MIGGFADWFGITALLKKPLGIPFRTEIIPRNRKKLVNSLIHMVENELLTKQILQEKIAEYDIVKKIIGYLDDDCFKSDVISTIDIIFSQFIEKINVSDTVNLVNVLAEDSLTEANISVLAIDAVEWSICDSYNEHTFRLMLDKAAIIVEHPHFSKIAGQILLRLFEKIQDNSDKERAGVKLLIKLVFSFIDMSHASTKLTAKIQNEALIYLNELKKPDSKKSEDCKKWISQTLHELKTNKDFMNTINNFIMSILKNVNPSPMIIHYISRYGSNSEETNSIERKNIIKNSLNKIVISLKENPEQQKKFDNLIKKALTQFIEKKHDEIGKIAKNKLESYSNEMLVELIETKAGNDLQIIRINGSVVGGIAGMIIFLLTHWMG